MERESQAGDVFLTIPEAADFLRCGQRTLRDLVARKAVPYMVFAGKALFSRNRLTEWLLSMEEPMEDQTKTQQAQTGVVFEDPQIVGCTPEKVELCLELISQLDGFRTEENKEVCRFVQGLARRLRAVFENGVPEKMPRKTYEKLSHWCNPRRHSGREEFVKERTDEISRILFGKVIERTGD